ncbi:MAG: NTP transferase domain-containing protein, partial [Hydrogenophaga sp.]|nr:NTP transferase domain-containing protein [Hydrogenophaga sp.]
MVVLAAGAGLRLGGVPKCLITIGNETLLERLLRAIEPLRPRCLVLVLGHHAEAVERALERSPGRRPRCIRNLSPGSEPSDSVRLGLNALEAGAPGVMLLLADLPLLDTQDLQTAWDAFHRRPAGTQVLVPQVGDVPGHPVVLTPGLARTLAEDSAPSLKEWRKAHPQGTYHWHTSNRHHVTDLDTPEDLQCLQDHTGLPCRLPGLTETTQSPSAA